jgi:hypothetical protein
MAHASRVRGLVWLPGGRMASLAVRQSTGGELRVWSGEGELLATRSYLALQEVRRTDILAASPRGGLLVAVSNDGALVCPTPGGR